MIRKPGNQGQLCSLHHIKSPRDPNQSCFGVAWQVSWPSLRSLASSDDGGVPGGGTSLQLQVSWFWGKAFGVDYHEHWTRQPQCTSERLATGTGIPFMMSVIYGFAVYTFTPYQIPQGPSPQCPTPREPNQSCFGVAWQVSWPSLRSLASSDDGGVRGGGTSLRLQGLLVLG